MKLRLSKSIYSKILLKRIKSIVILFILFLCVPYTIKFFISESLLVNKPGFSQAVYDRDGKLLRLFLSSDEKYRLWTDLKKISPYVISSTLSQEDSWFYWHPGVNLIALVRAAILSTFYNKNVGGSTITMQLARLRYNLHTKTYVGKLKQIVLALTLEYIYTKKEILEAYLNLVSYGGNIEGIGAASLIYFKKEPEDLTRTEAALLSVIPQRPHARFLERADKIEIGEALTKLISRNADLSEIKEEILKTTINGQRSSLPFRAPHFSERVASEDPFEGRIYTTLDVNLQSRIERLTSQFVKKYENAGIKNASVLIAEIPEMKVRAYIGSNDYKNSEIFGQVDGVRARRSPGSALKPFIYALALEKGFIHPESILKDTKFSRAAYNPENFDKEYIGPISSTEALIRSRNAPAVSLLNDITPEYFLNFLKDSGVANLRDNSFYGLTLALGGVEITMGELVSLYGALANGGVLKELKFLEHGNKENPKQIFSRESSFLILDMLKKNPHPKFAAKWDILKDKRSIAWKTGTSFGYRDAWTVGIAGPFVISAWVGNFDGSSNPAFVGRESAARLFFDLVDSLDEFFPKNYHEPNPPSGVKKILVCATSGEIPTENCKNTKETWFIPGKSPIHTCSVHREYKIDPKRNVRLCETSSALGESKIFEVWPSDIRALYKEAGIRIALIPPLAEECQLNNTTGKSPEIISPERGISYVQQLNNPKKIPLTAVVDGSSEKLFWFVDGKLLSETESTSPVEWQPQPGEHVIKVVDDSGRGSELRIKVLIVQ